MEAEIKKIKTHIQSMKERITGNAITDFQRMNLKESLKMAEDKLRLALAENIPLDRLEAIINAEREGRCVMLPCKVGDTVYIIGNCANVHMYRDDDYFTGTGATECPFEDSCDVEDCDDAHVRIFETVITDYWYGEQNGNNHPEVFAEHIGHGYMRSDIGKTVFMTREEAEVALRSKGLKTDE